MCSLTLEEEFIQAAAADHSWPLSHVEQWFILNTQAAKREGLGEKKKKSYTCPGGLKYRKIEREEQKPNIRELSDKRNLFLTSGTRIHTKSLN